jgi:hypothetical protein
MRGLHWNDFQQKECEYKSLFQPQYVLERWKAITVSAGYLLIKIH